MVRSAWSVYSGQSGSGQERESVYVGRGLVISGQSMLDGVGRVRSVSVMRCISIQGSLGGVG